MRVTSAFTLVPVLAAAVAVALAVPPGDTGDLAYFVTASEVLFSADWADAFSNSTVQIGPLQLGLFGAMHALAEALGLSTTRVIGVAVGVLVAGLLWLVARRLVGGRGGWWALLVASLVPIALGLSYEAYRDGHPAQVVVPLLWVLAGFEARQGRAWAAGGLVGLSAGFELWGLLGIVVFAAAPRVGVAVRAAADALLVILLLLAPFAFAGDFGMFDYRWIVNGDTLLSVFVEPGTEFTWPLRLLQGATALLAGAAVVWSLRRSTAALWAGPFVAVAVRLALDPVRYPWYWLALETLALVGAIQLAPTLGRLAASWRRPGAVEGSTGLT